MRLTDFAVEHATKLGAEYAEARFQSDVENIYILKNGNLEVTGLVRSGGIGVRVLVNGGLVFTCVNKPVKDLVRRRIEEAISIAKTSAKVMKKPTRLSDERTVKAKWEVKPKLPFEDVPIEDKIELLLDIDKTASTFEEVDTSIPYRIFEFVESKNEKYFVNSEGTRVSSMVPRIKFYGLLTCLEGGHGIEQDTIVKGESRGWEAIKDWNLIDEVKTRAKTLGKIVREAREAPKGAIDIILGNQVVGILVHESTGHPYEADRIFGREAAQAGESFVTRNMIGTRIGSEIVSVADDPTLKNGYGFYLYDDEGVPARRRLLMKDGVINELLHNRETASEIGINSNASARASGYGAEPIVRMANTFMLPGDHTFEELVKGIHFGIYMKTFSEWNIDDRRYNLRLIGRECYLIKNGELKDPIRRPILEMTTPIFYRSIDAIDKSLKFEAAMCGKGDPVQAMPVWHGGPNIRIRNVRLGGT